MVFCACETVHPYQRMYLNDKDMALKPVPESTYETSFESYREGAAGATGGKSGGGCGCNWLIILASFYEHWTHDFFSIDLKKVI